MLDLGEVVDKLAPVSTYFIEARFGTLSYKNPKC